MEGSEHRTPSGVNDCDDDFGPAGNVENDPVPYRATASYVDKLTDAEGLHPDSVLAPDPRQTRSQQPTRAS